MKVSIELSDRLFYDIEKKAKSLEICADKYISQLVEEKFYIDKYGDLNDLITDKSSESNKIKVEYKKGEENESKKSNDVKFIKYTENTDDGKNTAIADKNIQQTDDNTKLKNIIKRTRTLKSK